MSTVPTIFASVVVCISVDGLKLQGLKGANRISKSARYRGGNCSWPRKVESFLFTDIHAEHLVMTCLYLLVLCLS